MAKKSLPPPSWEYISALRVELTEKGQLKDDDLQIDEMREVRELKKASTLDANMQLVNVDYRDSTITDEGFRVAASMSVNPDKLTVDGGQSKRGVENATLREHFTESMFDVAGSRVPGMTTANAVKDGIVNDGGGWCKLLFTKDVWDYRYSIRLSQYEDDPSDSENPRTADQKFDGDTEDAKKAAGPPFTWLHVDARTVYPVWSGGKIREVMEVQQRPEISAFREYRLGRDREGNIVPDELGQGTVDKGAVGGSVRYIEVWDETYATVAIEGRNQAGNQTGCIVKQWRHGYGRHPYFQAFGLMMNHWRNRKVGWSIGQTKKWLTEYYAYLLNIQAQFAARDCMTPLFMEQTDTAYQLQGEDNRIAKKAEVWNLREIIKGKPGERLYPIAWAGTPAALKDAIALIKEAIDKLDTPRMNANLGSLEGAGFAINQVLAELKIKFDPLTQSYERMMCELTRFAWHLIRTKVREAVWVQRAGKESGYLRATPDDLKDTVGIIWAVDVEKPTAKLIEWRAYHERLQAGTLGTDQAIERMDDNSDEVHVSRSLDRIRETDQYKQVFDRYVWQEYGMGDLFDEAMEMAQAGMLPGRNGGMGAPGQVPPAMGSSIVPDMGAAAMTPGGGGAAPQNAPNLGMSPGAVVPEVGAGAGIQRIGP